MFRNPVTEFRLSAGRQAACPSYQPAVEALEERLMLNGDTTTSTTNTDPGLFAFQITKAVSSLALRLQHSHLSRAGLGNLLVTEMQLRNVIAQLQQTSQPTPGLQAVTNLFHAVDQVLVKEITAFANGRTPSAGLKNEAIALGATVQLIDSFNTQQ